MLKMAQVLLGMKKVCTGIAFKPRYRKFYQGLGAVANSVTDLNPQRFLTWTRFRMPGLKAPIITGVLHE